MRKVLFFLCIFLAVCTLETVAQEPLPSINVRNISGKIIISWTNEYHRVAKVINIQRSYDSLKNYTSIATMLNPENIDNGYVDAKPPYNHMYYRVFVAFDGGNYVFSQIKRPEKFAPGNELTAGDSIALYALKPFSGKRISRVYIGRENNVMVNLPDAEFKKYTIKFFDENDKPVFEVNKLHEPELIIEKVNFVHSGWFYFEVYEKGKLVEKDKFFLPKDDRPQLPQGEQGKRNNR